MHKTVKISLALIFVCLFVTMSVLICLHLHTEKVAMHTEEYAIALEAVTLKQGSSGTLVKQVQQKLINWGFLKGKADGIFGKATKTAVQKFQKKHKLTADGVVGKKTFDALGINANSSNSGNNSSSSNNNNNSSNKNTTSTNSDTYLLAKAIHGEARGESYTGQVAVGAVILNRVKSNLFPNTISGVIYQKNAFTAVLDGQINLEPNQSALNAAKDALNGYDPTGGCIYYYNPKTASSKWIFSRPIVTTIGQHVFCM